MDHRVIMLQFQVLVCCTIAVAVVGGVSPTAKYLVSAGGDNEAPHLVEDDPLPISSMIPDEDLIYSSGYFQGDMMMTEAEIAEGYGADVAAQARKNGETVQALDDSRVLGAARAGRRKWPANTIYYQFDSDYPESRKTTIRRALRDYASLTNIVVVESTGSGNYALIVDGGGCSSYVGMIGGAQRMTLAAGCMSKGTILHEFMHALGFGHEHTAPDRDNFVTVNLANVQSGRENNFNKITGSLAVSNSYDYSSVMHYSEYAFAISRSRKTIDCRGNACGQRGGFSAKDRDDINRLYPSNTRFPTRNPTRFPTRNPTRFPSRNPTRFPTRNPTRFPSRNPTRFPTRDPTSFPTRNPTAFPTRDPTSFPTRDPTSFPTRNPTSFPTRNPTSIPTRNPTGVPTRGPTRNPTIRTSEPSTSVPTTSQVKTIPPVVSSKNWTCESSGYDLSDGCSCECGVVDPDCKKPMQTSNANLFCGEVIADSSKFTCSAANVCTLIAVEPPPDDGTGNLVLLVTGGVLTVSALAVASVVVRGRRRRRLAKDLWAVDQAHPQFQASTINPMTMATPMSGSSAPFGNQVRTAGDVPRRPPRPNQYRGTTGIPGW